MRKALAEQVVVITGAASGIGHMTACGFADKGARVVVAARSIESITEIADAIRQAGKEALAVPTDAVHGTRAALSIMRAQGGGTIINIASIAGKRALPLQSAYSASKYAIVGFSEALRSELVHSGDKITISTICPPSINTPLFDHALGQGACIFEPNCAGYDGSLFWKTRFYPAVNEGAQVH